MLYVLGDGCMLFISAKREQHGTNYGVADGFSHTLNRIPFEVTQMEEVITPRVMTFIIRYGVSG